MKISEIFGWVWMNNIFGKPIKVNQASARVVVEPIPLTEEILLANGFKIESDGYIWYHPTYSHEQVYVHIALRHNGNVRRVEVKKQRAHFYRDTLPYAFSVHELQHALRLCGLNDLADNFKVEL